MFQELFFFRNHDMSPSCGLLFFVSSPTWIILAKRSGVVSRCLSMRIIGI